MNSQPATTTDLDWAAMLHTAADGCGMRAVYQPIVELATGHVAGYEALIRFVGYPVRNPQPWFAAAHVHGDNAELQATALRVALTERATLPPGRFLTLNVGAEALHHPAIRHIWTEQGDLHGLVIKLSEHRHDHPSLEPDLAALRHAGARLATAHTHLHALRPDLIQLGHNVIHDIDTDHTKQATVTAALALATSLGAQLLAQGIETPPELDTLTALGVPLGQGYHLGRPARPWANTTHRP